MPYQRMLFVAGMDDRHALVHLLTKHGIASCHFDEDEIVLIEDSIAVKSLVGLERCSCRIATL